MGSRAFVWVAIFIGSTIGGAIPALWGGEMLSYTSLLLSGIGAWSDCGLLSKCKKALLSCTRSPTYQSPAMRLFWSLSGPALLRGADQG